MVRSRTALIGAVAGLVALAWVLPVASPHRPADPCPSQPAAPTPTDRREGGDAARPGTVIQVRRYPDAGQPWDRGAWVRVRIDPGRLRAYNLSADDVVKVFASSTVIDSPPRPDPRPGVVFVPRLDRPERYEGLIVIATADGEVVRLRQLARVEAVGTREVQEAEPAAAPDRGRP